MIPNVFFLKISIYSAACSSLSQQAKLIFKVFDSTGLEETPAELVEWADRMLGLNFS
jgi:hypothetical protein